MGRIEVENARFIGLSQGGAITFEIPEGYYYTAALAGRKIIDKHNRYCQLIFGPPFHPKSTGRFSANNHAGGHARQIAAYVGDDPRAVLADACVATPDYPSSINKLGKMVPQPWSEASSEQAAAVIETLHRQASFLNLTLKEGDLWE